MSIFAVIILFVVYLKTHITTASSRSAGTAMFQQTNDKMLKIINDLFISLKIGKKISKYEDEYMSRHSLIQNTIYSNHKTYKKVHDISKTKISNKTAYYISNINEVIEEMIRSEAGKNVRNETIVHTLEDESVKDFVNLTRRFNLELKTIASKITVPKLKGSKANEQEEGRRIFEGSSTGIARYPFMASVHVAGRFVCAGSLLHESLALSAASCLMRTVDTKPHIQIRVASDYVSKMGSLVNIEELIFHPEFDRASLENNLVLLRTRKALRFRKQLVVAIQYDRANASVLRPEVEDLIILGWGKRRTDGTDVRDEDRPLSEGRLQIYDFDACQYIYTSDFVTDKSFCAGFVDRGAGACNHDAGGPALVNNVLAGVISFGSARCGAADAPTVLTRLGLHAAWLDAIVQSLAETQEIKPEEQIHISNMLREEADLDQAMKDVYKENFNVDEVLYGPIDPLYDDEMTNVSTKPLIRDFPTDPKMFPNPQLVANLASPKTLKPFVPPEGFWKDSSVEQTFKQTNDDYKLPARQFNSGSSTLLYSNPYQTTNQVVTEMTDSIYGSPDIYADNDEISISPTTTEAIKESVYAKDTEIKVNPQTYDPENAVYVEGKKGPKKTKGTVLREDFNSYNSLLKRYNDQPSTRLFLSSGNTMTYIPDQKQIMKVTAENAENEKAVIVYGPIDPLYGDEMTNVSTKPLLRDFPGDPKMFPNPQLVADLASPKTLKPFVPPEGSWKDSSVDQTFNQTNDDYKLPVRQFNSGPSTLLYSNLYQTTNQVVTEMTDSIYGSQDIYADNDEISISPTTTEAIKESVYAKDTEIKVNPQTYDPENAVYVEGKRGPKKTKGTVLREDFNSYNNLLKRYNDQLPSRIFLSSGNTMTYIPDQNQIRKATAEKAEIEKAVIVMSDSGTTQIIELNRNDPLYQRGFKMFAAKMIRSKFENERIEH